MDPAEAHDRRLRAFDAKMLAGLRAVAPEVLDIAGAVAGGGRPGWWVNQCNGLGQSGPVTADDVAAITDFYKRRGAEPRIELVDACDPSAVRHVADAGYRVAGFETTLTIDLPAELPAPAGDVAESDDLDEAIVTMERGFAGDDHRPSEAEMGEWRHVLSRPGTRHFIARVGGEPVGAGSLDVKTSGGDLPRVGFLFGGSVRAAFRRRGLHRDLILARLHAAIGDGCGLAMTMGVSGGPTTRNALRLGMVPLCTVVAFVRPGDGLVSSL